MAYRLFFYFLIYPLSLSLFAQQVDWARSFSSADSEGNDIAADLNGNYYALGSFGSEITLDTLVLSSNRGGYQTYLAKFNPSGRIQWCIVGFGGEFTLPLSIKLVENKLFITGMYRDSLVLGNHSIRNINSSNNVFIAKIDTSGTTDWIRGCTSTSISYPNGGSNGLRIGFAPDGSIFGACYFVGNVSLGGMNHTSAGNDDILLMKMDRQGNFIWTKRTGGPNYEYLTCIEVLNNDEFLIGGSFDAATQFDSYTAHGMGQHTLFYSLFDRNANCRFLKSANYNGIFSSTNTIFQDSKKNIIISFSFGDSLSVMGHTYKSTYANPMSSVIFKLDSSYNVITDNFNRTNSHGISAYAIGLDKADNIYIKGRYGANAQLEGQPLYCEYIGNEMIAKYCSTGEYKWVQTIEGRYEKINYGYCLAGEYLYFTGSFSHDITVGPYTLSKLVPYYVNDDAYVAKLNVQQCGTPPSFTLHGNACHADSLVIVATQPGISKKWFYNNNALPFDSDSITVTQNGLYSLMHIDSTACCFTMAHIPISLDNRPDPDFSVRAATHLCAGDSAYLFPHRQDYAYYEWQRDHIVFSLDTSCRIYTSGNYTLLVKDNLGCEAISDPQYIVFNPQPAIDLGSDTVFCNTAEYLLDGGAGNISYVWNTGSINRYETASKTGVFTLKVEDANHCLGYDTVSIEIPVITMDRNQSLCDVSSVEIGFDYPGGHVLWSDGTINSRRLVSQSGTYSFTFSKGSCLLLDSVQVSLKDKLDVSLANMITPNGDAKNDYFEIPAMSGVQKILNIYNSWGALVYSSDIYEDNWQGEGVGAEIYFYELELKMNECKKKYTGWLHVVK